MHYLNVNCLLQLSLHYIEIKAATILLKGFIVFEHNVQSLPLKLIPHLLP